MIVEFLDDPETSAAKQDYYRAVSRDSGAEAWFKLMEKLPGALEIIGQDKAKTGIVETLVANSARLGGGQLTKAHFRNADIRFRGFPNLEHLTGAEKWIPVVEFHNLRSYYDFCHAMNYESPPQGVTRYVPTEALLASMDAKFMEPMKIKPTGIIIYCSEPIPGAMPPNQIRDHESVHCVDPLFFARRSIDKLILEELIATIGEFASKEVSMGAPLDDYRLNSHPVFWANYYIRLRAASNDLKKILWPEGNSPDPLTVENLANATVKFVHDLTKDRKNSEIVRLLMRCLNFKEVYEELCVAWPERYRETAVARRDDTANAVVMAKGSGVRGEAPGVVDQQVFGQARRIMTHYYQGWPRVYTLGERHIASLWQAEGYARQAMMGFFLGPAIARESLRLLSELSRHQFDTTNLEDFKVEIRKVGENYQITVSW